MPREKLVGVSSRVSPAIAAALDAEVARRNKKPGAIESRATVIRELLHERFGIDEAAPGGELPPAGPK